MDLTPKQQKAAEKFVKAHQAMQANAERDAAKRRDALREADAAGVPGTVLASMSGLVSSRLYQMLKELHELDAQASEQPAPTPS